MRTTARAEAERTEHRSCPVPGRGERFARYAMMGLPFSSGHYLALRRFPANPFRRSCHSVWHRDPDGTWVFYADTPTFASCTRYFDAAISVASTADISITWTGDSRLNIEVGGGLGWNIELQVTTATVLMTGAGRLMLCVMRDNGVVLAAMGRAAAPALGAGRVQLAGTAPNGQWFKANPLRICSIADSTAVVHGVDVGPPGPLPKQTRLADFWLRGIFSVGETSFEDFDPTRHHAPRPATKGATR